MGKVATELLIAGKRDIASYSYTLEDGQIINLFFRPMNDIEEEGAKGIARALYHRYVTGGYMDDDGVFQSKPDILYSGDFQAVELNFEALKKYADLQMMQKPPIPEDVYTAVELARIAFSEPLIFQKIETDATPHWLGKGWAKKERREEKKTGTNPLSSDLSTEESDIPPISNQS